MNSVDVIMIEGTAVEVFKETGLTPSQLLEQRDELLNSLEEVFDSIDNDMILVRPSERDDFMILLSKWREAITKAKGSNK